MLVPLPPYSGSLTSAFKCAFESHPSELSGYCLRQAVTARICLVTSREVAVNSCRLRTNAYGGV